MRKTIMCERGGCKNQGVAVLYDLEDRDAEPTRFCADHVQPALDSGYAGRVYWQRHHRQVAHD